MRSIKFRGKRVDNGEWIYGDLLTFNGTDCELCDWNTVDCSRYDVDPKTVGQFTGLLDKNNTEIYEGDVAQTTNRLGVVEFNYGMFCVNDHNEETSNYYEDPANNWEIIGNIHDSPELLIDE